MIDDGLPAAAVGAGIAGASDDVARRLVRVETLQQGDELPPLLRLDHIIGIEPEGIIAGRVRERRVAGGGEVVDPGEIEDLRPELPGDLARAIDAAGIDDDDLIEDPAHRLQAVRQVLLLVADDHRQADPGLPRPLSALEPLCSVPPPRPQRHPTPRGDVAAPLRREPPRVLLQQALGVDAVAGERPAAEVVDEQVVRHGQLEPRPPRPQGQVVVVEEPQPEPLVQPADGLVHGPRHQQAEAGELARGEPLPAVLVAPAPGEGVHRVEVAIGDVGDELRRRGVVGHRPDQADRRRPVAVVFQRGAAQSDELIEPAVGDDRVVVEQHQVFTAGRLQAPG